MCSCCRLEVPGTKLCLEPGATVKLGRFESVKWIVAHGWYSYAGNRQVCGWYLTNKDNHSVIKPLSITDLDDIYLIEN